MSSTDHLLSDVLVASSGLSPENSFAPLLWYFEHPLWVREVRAPGNVAHNYPLPIRIRGALNRESLEHSLQEVVRRHSVLRSVFRVVNGELSQMIMPSQQLTIPLVDLSDMAEGERQIKALEIGINDATRPFMLNSGPMLRARLLRLAPEDHILLLTTHHVVCDDWSTGILVHELLGIYDAFNARKPSPFPEVSYQYSDFARRVHQQLQNKNLESRLAFWNRRLQGAS